MALATRNPRERWVRSAAALAAVALATVGVTLAQQPGGDTKDAAREKAAPPRKDQDKARKGGLRAPGGPPPKKLRRNAADPFARHVAEAGVGGAGVAAGAGAGVAAPAWPYHYKFKLTSFDGTPLAAVYFPAQRTNAPAVLLLHEKGRLARDFEDNIEDLKDKGLAEYLQAQGYAVLELDFRGHGANPRKEIGPRDGPLVVRDLQAAYEFLVDRHNREELNLAKFGVVAIGEGANLAAAWAATAGGAVSSEGRISDLGALVCVSPVKEGFGFDLARILPSIAQRLPMLLMTGERDNQSLNPVKEAQPIIARPPQRQSKVEYFPTSLHGYKLLRFQPKVADAIVAFFESTIKKIRVDEWEPRYILTPVAYSDIELVRKKAGPTAKAEAKKDAAKDEVQKKDEAQKDKGKGEDKAKADEKAAAPETKPSAKRGSK